MSFCRMMVVLFAGLALIVGLVAQQNMRCAMDEMEGNEVILRNGTLTEYGLERLGVFASELMKKASKPAMEKYLVPGRILKEMKTFASGGSFEEQDTEYEKILVETAMEMVDDLSVNDPDGFLKSVSARSDIDKCKKGLKELLATVPQRLKDARAKTQEEQRTPNNDSPFTRQDADMEDAGGKQQSGKRFTEEEFMEANNDRYENAFQQFLRQAMIEAIGTGRLFPFDVNKIKETLTSTAGLIVLEAEDQ